MTKHSARHIVPREQTFLWGGRLPVGHISVIAGQPGKGKSTLGYRILADVNVPTIFVSTEEVPETVWRPRIEAAGVNLDLAFHHSHDLKFSRDTEDRAYLEQLIDDYEAKLIVVDPLSNHLRGASIHRDEQVRAVFEQYQDLIQEKEVVLLLQLHVLRSVNPKNHPFMAMPAGVVSIAKAAYLLGADPRIEADPDIRILACADRFNFGGLPPKSIAFEFEERAVWVKARSGRKVKRDFGVFTHRGESEVTAAELLRTFAPESKERKRERVEHHLLTLLVDGPKHVSEIRDFFQDLMPPISWSTVKRVQREMPEIVERRDPEEGRRMIWSLEPDVPDTLPEDWPS